MAKRTVDAIYEGRNGAAVIYSLGCCVAIVVPPCSSTVSSPNRPDRSRQRLIVVVDRRLVRAREPAA